MQPAPCEKRFGVADGRAPFRLQVADGKLTRHRYAPKHVQLTPDQRNLTWVTLARSSNL